MKTLFFCPLWGNEHLPFELFAEKVKEAGYHGVEMSLPWKDISLQERILKVLDNQGLRLIAQHHETSDPDPAAHLIEYRSRLENLVSVRPLQVNTQTGKDWFSYEQNKRLIDTAHSISEKSGVKIVHETHRGKFSFCAQVTARYLALDEHLRIAADFSHWCVVSESLLEDQQDNVQLAISRSDHIHTRVGHPQGPQVSDPRAPEWENALNAHIIWWEKIIVCHKEAGNPFLTITPEFGPHPYMPAFPYSRQPVASQWEINLYMMNLLRQRAVNLVEP